MGHVLQARAGLGLYRRVFVKEKPFTRQIGPCGEDAGQFVSHVGTELSVWSRARLHDGNALEKAFKEMIHGPLQLRDGALVEFFARFIRLFEVIVFGFILDAGNLFFSHCFCPPLARIVP